MYVVKRINANFTKNKLSYILHVCFGAKYTLYILKQQHLTEDKRFCKNTFLMIYITYLLVTWFPNYE